MSPIELIRTIRFSASHHYRFPEWSRERNQETFGATAEAHVHDYSLEVTVAGEPDPRTGFVVDLSELDALLEEVVDPLRGGSLNEGAPEFQDGTKLTSTEHLAVWFWEQLHGRIPGTGRLLRVRVFEDPSLGASYGGAE